MGETQEIVRRASKYSTEDVEAALQLIALNRGSTQAVSEQTEIPRETLNYWVKSKYADRYAQIRAEIVPKIQAELAARHEDMARQALDRQQEAFELMRLQELKQADLVKAARDLSVTAAVHTDKTQLLRDRPTAIIEKRSAQDILRSLPDHLVVDGEATEIDDVALLTEADHANAR